MLCCTDLIIARFELATCLHVDVHTYIYVTCRCGDFCRILSCHSCHVMSCVGYILKEKVIEYWYGWMSPKWQKAKGIYNPIKSKLFATLQRHVMFTAEDGLSPNAQFLALVIIFPLLMNRQQSSTGLIRAAIQILARKASGELFSDNLFLWSAFLTTIGDHPSLHPMTVL